MSPTQVRQKQIYVVVRGTPRKHHGTVHRLSYSKPYFFCNIINDGSISEVDMYPFTVLYLILINVLTELI